MSPAFQTRRARSLLALAATALLAVPFAPGCTNETVHLLDLPVTDAGIPVTPEKCATSATCPDGYYCALPSCGALAGTCEAIPLTCPDAGPDDSTEQLVCGCDKITYWNSCLSARFGVPSYTEGACQNDPNDPTSAPPCGPEAPGSKPCAAGLWCVQLGGSMHGPEGDACDHPPLGSCWALPAKCPTSPPTGLFLWDSCSTTGAVCIDTCQAIKQGGTYRGSQQCPS